MTNEKLENQRKEYLRFKDELNKKKVLNNFRKELAVKEKVWNKLSEERFEYKKEYCTENFNKEIKKEHETEMIKNICKKIKKKHFKIKKIDSKVKKEILVTTLSIAIISSLTLVGDKSYKAGRNSMEEELVSEISSKQLKRYNLDTAPSKLIESWADAEIMEFDRVSQDDESLREKFNLVLENEYGNVKRCYYEYIETGSEDDRKKLIQSAEALMNKLKSIAHNRDFSFNSSKFAYAILRDSDGNFIDYETLEPNLEVYEAVGIDINGNFESGDVLYDGAFYRKYDNSSRIQTFKLK